MDIRYKLTESVVTVAGAIEYVTDEFMTDEFARKVPVEVRGSSDTSATVTLALRADEAHERTVRFGRGWADEDFTVVLTPDQRLSSITYKSVGIGSSVITSAATILAFVGGIAARIVGGRPGIRTGPGARRGAPTPEQKAKKKWEDSYPKVAALRTVYDELVESAAESLGQARRAAVAATEPSEQVAALARARRLEQVLEDGREELDRIDSLYRSWRAGTKSIRTEMISHDLSIVELPRYEGSVPDPNGLTGAAKRVWMELGVIVQVELPDDRRERNPSLHDPPIGGDADESKRVRWRVPRQARLRVWRCGKDGTPVLERHLLTFIVDNACGSSAVTLKKRFFGEDSVALEFGEYGMPTKLVAGERSALGSFADALAGIPAVMAGGLESATNAQASLTGLLDAKADRELSGLKWRVEKTRQELESKGLAATANQFAELKRLEQQVQIAEAQGRLTPSSVLSQ